MLVFAGHFEKGEAHSGDFLRVPIQAHSDGRGQMNLLIDEMAAGVNEIELRIRLGPNVREILRAFNWNGQSLEVEDFRVE